MKSSFNDVIFAFVYSDGSEDPLDDHGMISQQLEQLSTIGRCEYEKTCSLLVQLCDESAQRYQELMGAGHQNPDLAVEEGKYHMCDHMFQVTFKKYRTFDLKFIKKHQSMS